MKKIQLLDNLLTLFLYKRDYAGFNSIVKTLSPKFALRTLSVNLILLGKLNQGHYNDALKFIKDHPSISDSITLNLSLRIYSVKNDWKNFEKTLSNIEANHSIIDYFTILDFYSKKKNFDKVMHYIRQQFDRDHVLPSVHVELLVHHLVESKQFEKLDQMFHLIVDADIKDISIFNVLLEVYYDLGLTERFETVFEATAGIRDLTTYQIGIEWYCKMNELEKVLSLANTMKQKKFEKTNKILIRLIKYFAKLNLPDRIASLDIPESPASDLIEALMEFYSKRDLITTVRWYERCQENPPPLGIQNLLLSCFITFDLPQRVDTLVNSIESPSLHTYTILLEYYFTKGREMEVEEILLKKAIPINNVYMNTLMNGYSNKKEYDKVIQVFQENRTNPDVYIYCTVMNAYFEKKEFEKVFEMVQEMYKKRITVTKPIYRVMIKTHIANNKPEKAKELQEKMDLMK
jgi:pentatricopeptide repeat protein